MIVLYGWKVNVQEQANFTFQERTLLFRGRSGGQLSKTERSEVLTGRNEDQGKGKLSGGM